MCPRNRAATSSHTTNRSGISIDICANAMFMDVCVMLAEAGVSTGQKAVLLAPQGNGRPLRIGHQMPSFSLVLAEGLCLVDINIDARILARQAIGSVTFHNVLILAYEDFRNLYAIHDESGVCGIRSTCDHIGDFELGDTNHERGQHTEPYCWDGNPLPPASLRQSCYSYLTPPYPKV